MSARLWIGILGLTLCLPAVATAQVDTGTQYVSFWRGTFRVFTVRPQTRITLLDLDTGLPLSPAAWTGNFATNPFVLQQAGDSFEGETGQATYRIRVVAETAAGPVEPKPVVVWTGSLATGLKHPAAPPPDQNAWASYVPDVEQPGPQGGSELGQSFLGFSSRDLIVFAQVGADPTRITVEDLATNTDPDSDDTLVLDASSPELVHSDAQVEIYEYHGFEDDTIRITSNRPTSVLAGIFSSNFTDWAASPPSYRPTDNGRELGTLFYVFAPHWLTIFPVFEDTFVQVTDLSDGDDTTAVALPEGGFFNPFLDVYVSDRVGNFNQPAIPRSTFPNVRFVDPPGGRLDDDYVRIESSRPVLVSVGPVSSNLLEFADVAYAVPVSSTQRLVHAYAQNGAADDLQVLAVAPDQVVSIRSLSHTQGFRTATNHDFDLPAYSGGNAITDDWFWSSGIWDGELLRITSQGPLQVMAGDYDGPNFGAFIPFIPVATTEPPVANAGPDREVCPDATVTLSGSTSFDADDIDGSEMPTWQWDLDVAVDSDGNGTVDDDVDAVGESIDATFPEGTTTVQLTFTDDDGEVGVDRITIIVGDSRAPIVDCPRQTRAIATDFAGGPASPVATVLDDCDPNPFLTNDRTAGGADASDVYPCGVTAVTWTGLDAHGNADACTGAVVLQPEGGFPSFGDHLRVTKDALGSPSLDWSGATLEPDSKFVVLRADDSATTRDAFPVSLTLSALSWREPEPGAATVLFYDVRLVKCDGSTGGG